VVVFQEPSLKVRVKSGKREQPTGRGSFGGLETRQMREQALFDRTKESFNFSSPAWMTRPGKNQRHFQISGDLFQMATGKVWAIIRVELSRNPTQMPSGIGFSPDSLVQDKRSLLSVGTGKPQGVSSDSATVT
jgi:hypothetical protein